MYNPNQYAEQELNVEKLQYHKLIYSGYVYKIPKFQRNYSWDENNWKKLIEGITNSSNNNKFLGCLFFLDKFNRPYTIRVNEVVDGQQRLVTLSLLMVAIKKIIDEKTSEFEEFFRNNNQSSLFENFKDIFKIQSNSNDLNQFSELRNEREHKYILRLQPSFENKNYEDYFYLLQTVGILKPINKIQKSNNAIKEYENRQIYKCFNYFYTKLNTNSYFDNNEDIESKNNTNFVENIFNILISVLNQNFIIFLEQDSSQVYLLFDTINNAGVSLSAFDIIKNKIFEKYDSTLIVNNDITDKERKLDELSERWIELIDNLPNRKTNDTFVRRYYNAFKFKTNYSIDRIQRATNSNIISVYETLIDNQINITDFIDHIFLAAELYNKLNFPLDYIKSKSPKSYELEFYKNLVKLNTIGAGTSYIFLLYFLLLEDSHLNMEGFIGGRDEYNSRLVEILIKFYFRRNVTDTPATKFLDNFNITLINECNKIINGNNKIDFNRLKDIILQNQNIYNKNFKTESLNSLKTKLEGNLYSNNAEVVRFALITLAISKEAGREINELRFWDQNESGKKIWSIEHILPQKKNISDDWVRSLNKISSEIIITDNHKENAKRIMTDNLHKIGNLTFTGYNSKISTRSFIEKRDLLSKEVYIGFKNDFCLNNLEFPMDATNKNNLKNINDWNEDTIKSRTEVIVNELINLFKFDKDEI